MQQIDVIGLGFCAMDHIGLLPGIPQDDKVELLASVKQGGGPAATSIVTLARLGMTTGVIGCVGDDDDGRAIIRELANEHVDTSHMIVQTGQSSANSFVWVEQPTGNRSIAWSRGTLRPLELSELDRHYIEAARALHLDGTEMAVSRQAAIWAKDAGGIVALDAGTVRPGMTDLLPFVDILNTSGKSVMGLAGKDSLDECGRALLDLGPKLVTVTCGNKGCMIFADGLIGIQGAFQIDAVDTTGAGDVFCGGLIYGYLHGWDPGRIVEFASAMSAMKCQKLGGRAGIPDLQTVRRFLAEHSVLPLQP
ncbi:MAG TPA: carbohydrate kinase family protein [Armatimonadota bacterium]|nr:carbohydrate kinase family protein [Armatimonadota bacterium]